MDGQNVEDLPNEPEWNLTNWGIPEGGYDDLHRFAVTQHDLFSSMNPIPMAPQAIRRLEKEGIRIRIITHRLFISYFHQRAVQQTVEWLDRWGIPYWDLCFMRRKEHVDADLYVEDSPENIKRLLDNDKHVVIISNATNRDIAVPKEERADSWLQAEMQIRKHYYRWLDENGLAKPDGPGRKPIWADTPPGDTHNDAMMQ